MKYRWVLIRTTCYLIKWITKRRSKMKTHPSSIRSSNLINLPNKVLKVCYIPLPVFPPMVASINNQKRLPPTWIVTRPWIAILLISRATVGRSWSGWGRFFFKTIVPDIRKLKRWVITGWAWYCLGEVGHVIWIQAYVTVCTQNTCEAYGLGHGRMIPHEENAGKSYSVHLTAQKSLE